ncbi:MAG: ATP synthase subunit I [Ilumatobacteraceae bacterium]
MTMNHETVMIFLVLVAGIGLGLFFYGGLWFTTRKALTMRYAQWTIFGSFMLRTGLSLGGMYALSGGDWKRLVLCLAGFVIGRLLVQRYTKEKGAAGNIAFEKNTGDEA